MWYKCLLLLLGALVLEHSNVCNANTTAYGAALLLYWCGSVAKDAMLRQQHAFTHPVLPPKMFEGSHAGPVHVGGCDQTCGVAGAGCAEAVSGHSLEAVQAGPFPAGAVYRGQCEVPGGLEP